MYICRLNNKNNTKNNTMKRLSLLFALFALPIFIVTAKEPQKIIFDTDMGNDVDDVIALDMLYKYHDAGDINLLGIVSSRREVGSVQFLDVMNTLYGYPTLPIGIVKTYPTEGYKMDPRVKYAEYTAAKHPYARSVKDYEALPDGYKLFRRLLAAEEDGSVTIVAVGFSTNLSRLVASPADEFSPLTGKELIARKVKRVVMMAGNFYEQKPEYNIRKDIVAATRFIEECPVEILFSDYKLGHDVLYPFTALYDCFGFMEHHPAIVAFEYYGTMPYNRPSWDPTAVLYAVELSGKYASLSKRGYVTVNQKGVTIFTEDNKSKHRYFTTTDAQRMATLRRIIEITKRRPKLLKIQ